MRYIFLLVIASLSSIIIYAQADIILKNGKIFTSNKRKLWVQAIAIKGNKILAAGTDKEILELTGPSTNIIDLEQHLVVPGFNDAHTHIGASYPAYSFSVTTNETGPTPWAIIRDSLQKIVRTLPAGTLIRSTIHPDLLEDGNVRREQLDRIAPNHPVILSAWTGHGKICNAAALRLLNYSPQTKLVGGIIQLENEQPSGVLEEYAGFQSAALLADRLDDKEAGEMIRKQYAAMLELGITSTQNMCTQMSQPAFQRIYSANDFGGRVRLIAFPFTDDKGLLFNDWSNSFRNLTNKNCISGVKLILDGTPIERLACTRQPYSDKDSCYGRLNFSESAIAEYLKFCIANDQQIIVHAVGDSSIATLISVMRSIEPDNFWPSRRVRLEHADLAIMGTADIATLRKLGIVIVQNPTHLTLVGEMAGRWADRTPYLQALGTLIKSGIPVAIGSDGPFNPYLNLMLATMHPDNPKEALTLEDAVIAYTFGSAYAEFKENEKGVLNAGKLADLAVLSQNIFDIPAQQIPATTSILTIVDGKIVYNKKVLK